MVFFFPFIVIFCLWAMYEMKKGDRIKQQKTEAFWQRERDADSVRKQDISHLDYINIPDDLPVDDSATGDQKKYQDSVMSLRGEKILNLTGMSNTDLKLKYGPANLETLSGCDARYTILARDTARWGEELYKLGRLKDARRVLEFGISTGTDVSSNYSTLAKVYRDLGEPDRIHDLLAAAMNLNTLMRDSIVSSLNRMIVDDDSDLTKSDT